MKTAGGAMQLIHHQCLELLPSDNLDTNAIHHLVNSQIILPYVLRAFRCIYKIFYYASMYILYIYKHNRYACVCVYMMCVCMSVCVCAHVCIGLHVTCVQCTCSCVLNFVLMQSLLGTSFQSLKSINTNQVRPKKSTAFKLLQMTQHSAIYIQRRRRATQVTNGCVSNGLLVGVRSQLQFMLATKVAYSKVFHLLSEHGSYFLDGSFIQAISKAPLQVYYYSEALPPQHADSLLC